MIGKKLDRKNQLLPYWYGNMRYFFTDFDIAHKFKLAWLLQQSRYGAFKKKTVHTERTIYFLESH